MKTRYILLAFTALAMSACARNVEPAEPESIQMTFTAYQEGAAPTKSTVLNGGTQVYWEPGDEIKVFFNGSSGRFTSQNTENASSATFTGTLPVVVGGNEGAGITTKTWGLYPYRADAVLDGDAMVTTLPAAQTGRAGSFAKNTNITLAHSEGYGLAFYNVCGGLRFSLTQEGIKRITFEGNNGEALAGKIKIAFEDGGVPVVSEVVAKDSVLTLTAPGDGTFQTGVWYYLSAIPGTLSGGYKIVFYKESEYATRTSTNPVTIKRGIFGSLANADDGLVFLSQDAVDLGLSVNWGSCNIGANWPEEAGGHYQWAGLTDVTSTSIYLDWDNCPYHTGTSNITGWTKYILSAHASHWSGEGAPDNKTVLDPEDDIAHVTLGDDWRMPTKEEWAELLDPDNCSWVKTQHNGVNGYLVTSKKAGYTDKSIFLPAVGNRDHDIFTRQETGGFYWSSSLYESISRWGWSVVFDGDTLGLYAVGRYGARAVRPVKGSGSGNSGIIQFADPAAKYACVAKFDTDGDGEVSIKEAEAATSFEGLFTDWKGVTSFDEISFFKNVHSLSGVFNGCDKLVSITVPDNITDLGTSAFNGCSALTSVVLPSGIMSIGNYTFQNCNKLNSVVIPSNVTLIGQYAFAGCSVLSGLGLPSNVHSIGRNAFQNCSAIESLVLPEGIESIPDYCFQNCTNLATISLPNTIIRIGNYAFDGCRFENNNYMLRLPSSITSIGSHAFGYIRHLLLPSTTPISITADSFVSIYTLLYVPANMVEMYKVRTNWTNYADRIRSIDDYPIPFTIAGTVGDAVDLGLNVKWSSWNVGASAPEEYGAYFAWGEVEPKQTYEWTTYKWCNGNGQSLTKYNHDGNHGIVDGKVVLDLEDDAARVNWGGNWRMPGYGDVAELTNTRSDSNYKWEWKAISGHNGWEITYLVNGNSIFLPAAGSPNYFWSANNDGRYWIRSYAPYDSPTYAYDLGITSSDVFASGGRYWSRYCGLSVRPVCE